VGGSALRPWHSSRKYWLS